MDYLARQMPDSSSLRIGKQVFLLYLLDYVVIVVLFLAISALNFVKPFNQHFALQNYTLQYPYAKHERVPDGALYACAILAPAAIIAAWTLAIDPLLEGRRARRAGRQRDPYRKGFWELNCGILGLLLANTAAYLITGVLKNAIGKPRPDLIDRCQPNIPQDQFVSPVFGLSDSSICTQKDMSILHDGFRSFPSGHSSSSFSGLFYLSLFLAGKLHFLDHQGSVWKVFVVLVPTLGAALIAGSRIMDARHHPFDVITGSMLGILCAYVAYRQYFPSVTEFDRMGRAYTTRRHHGATGPEPVRTVHRAMPSFSFEPADTPLMHEHEHDQQHSKPYSPLDYDGSGGNPVGVQRTRSQALAAEPLRQQQQKPLHQRTISNPSNARTSLGPELGANGAGLAALSRTYSPDPSFASQASGNDGSLFGRPSAEGPLGTEHQHAAPAWQQQQQQQYAPYRPRDDLEALRRSEFPGSPPLDGPSTPIEMNPLPSPKGTLVHHQQQQQQQQQQQEQQQQHQIQSPPPPMSPPPMATIQEQPASHQRQPSLAESKAEEAALESPGNRFSFVEGGEHLVHPAFRNQPS